MPRDLVFDLSPTQSRFVHSEAEIVQLYGSMGEGKTYAACVAILAHAARCGRPLRGAIVRDTHQNLKMSTVPDLKEVFGDYLTCHDDDKRLVLHTTPKVELYLFGANDAADLAKFQSLIVGFIWLEEPAAIEEKGNAGLPKAVFEMAVARASRQAGTKMRVQITQNPATEDHWTEELFQAPAIYARDPDTGVVIRKECLRIKYGENKYLNAHTRAANRAAFQNDPGKFARYVEGRAAPILTGQKVTPEYDPDRHYADEELPVVPGAIGVRAWDGWHNPSCIVGQWIQPGKLWIHDVVVGEGCGVKELIEQEVLHLMNSPKYQGIDQWEDVGDPTLHTPDQSTRTTTSAQVIERLLKTRVERGATRWQARIQPTKAALVGGKVRISKSAYLLHRALNGGWHWKTDRSGHIIGTVPVKDQFSHPADGFTYLCGKYFPIARHSAEDTRRMVAAVKAKNKAMSYAPSRRAGGMGR